MWRGILLAAVASFLIAATAPAFAQQMGVTVRTLCQDRDKVTSGLRAQFKEHRDSHGIDLRSNFLVELWVNEENGTASVVVTNPENGLSCILVGMESWVEVGPMDVPPEDEEGA